MDINAIKEKTNQILLNRIAESSFIEYKKSEIQVDKIIKTICAYGNNYYRNDLQFIFIGVEEENNEKEKAIPKLPIEGIPEEKLELVYNNLCSLKPYLTPNIKFDVIKNKLDNKNYLIIVVPNQKGGPFSISDKFEKDFKIKLKPGRYIKNDFESRIANINEEFDLIRKFANYYFDEDINETATFNNINFNLVNEYLNKISNRMINSNLSNIELAETLELIDKNDPNNKKIYNHAVLMFTDKPDDYIKNAYIELIVDINGTKRAMESRIFRGPIWHQYMDITDYVQKNYLNSITIREDNNALNRMVDNFPFTAFEELMANAIVHNDYQNAKAIQVYINEREINIINYNNPLPPIEIKDLNERRTFNERNFINPNIRKRFKELHIIESYGTGIGEAKKALENNGSPQLYYKEFNNTAVTSVVIPVNEEYYKIKQGHNINIINNIQNDKIQSIILQTQYSNSIKNALLNIYKSLSEQTFSNRDIQSSINVGETTATKYIKILKQLGVIKEVNGTGKGKYHFI